MYFKIVILFLERAFWNSEFSVTDKLVKSSMSKI